MRNHLFKRMILLVYILLLFFPLAVNAEKKETAEITVEWIYSPESRKAWMLPRYKWLNNGTAVLYDERIEPGKRNFEVLNPGTGKRKPLLNMQKAMESLQTFLGKERSPNVLEWPDSWEESGARAIFRFNDDIFLLHFPAARFYRVTDTKEKEIGAILSPDGEKIAYVRQNNIYIYDTLTGTEKPVTTNGSETLLNGTLSDMYMEDVFLGEEVGLWWSPDSKALAFLRSDVSRIGQLYYTDIQPYFPRMIPQRYPIVGGAISTVRIGIAEIGPNEIKSTWVKLDQDSTDFYIVHVDWLPDSQRLGVQVLNRAQDELDLYLARRSNGQCQHILKETNDTWINVGDDIYFLKDGSHFIWGSERKGFKHLYLYNINGKQVNQITKGEWSVRGPFQYAFWKGKSAVSIDEKQGWLYFTSLEKSSLERHLYRIKLDGSRMLRMTKEDGFHSVTFSPDGRYYFDQYSNCSTLPSLFLYSKNGKRLQVVAKAHSHLLDKFGIQYPELMTIPADDGFPLPAHIYKPKNFDPAKKYPVIIYHYGGPSAPVITNGWNPNVYFSQVLLKNGFLVFSVDNRSATAIGKKYEDVIFKQMKGPNELKDLLAGVKWLKSQPYVDPNRVGVWGWSYGGCFTLMAMTQSREFKAGIAVAAVSDMRFHSPKWTEFAMKRPEDNPEAYEKVSLLNHAKNLHGRLLLVHGTYDDNVRIQSAWRFADELIKAGKPFDMMFYPMRKHGISDPPARIHLFNKMVAFWKRYLSK